MSIGPGEGIQVYELSEQDRLAVAGRFEAANMHEDKSERDELGRQLMGLVFDRIKRPDLKRGIIYFTSDGANVIMQDGRVATYLDYLAIASDNPRHGPAAQTILNFIEYPSSKPGVDEKYDGGILGLTQLIEKKLQQQQRWQ